MTFVKPLSQRLALFPSVKWDRCVLFPMACPVLTLPDSPFTVSDSGLSELLRAGHLRGGMSSPGDPALCLVLETFPQPVAI